MIQDSPLRRVQRPTARRQERPAWTGEQARAFLLAAAGDPDYAIWLTLLTTGARIGEALALGWADVGWDAGSITIRRTLTQNRAHAEVLGVTTKGGRIRTTPAPPVLIAALRAHRARQAEARLAVGGLWRDRGPVFCDEIRDIRRSAGVRSRLDALIAAAGLPRLTPHGLRHTAASLLAEHAPIAVARDVLGHSSVAITDRYVHGTDAARRAGSDTLARIVAGS